MAFILQYLLSESNNSYSVFRGKCSRALIFCWSHLKRHQLQIRFQDPLAECLRIMNGNKYLFLDNGHFNLSSTKGGSCVILYRVIYAAVVVIVH